MGGAFAPLIKLGSELNLSLCRLFTHRGGSASRELLPSPRRGVNDAVRAGSPFLSAASPHELSETSVLLVSFGRCSVDNVDSACVSHNGCACQHQPWRSIERAE